MAKGEKTKKLWQNTEYRKKKLESHKGKNPSNLNELISIAKSKEGRKRMSKRMKGKSPWNKGKKGLQKFSIETRRKMSEVKIGKKHSWGLSGKDSPSWKGGISKIDKLCRAMSEYKQWRSDVFQRDNWTCRTCNFSKGYVTAHHIKGFNKIIKENNIININLARECKELWNINNGITLCEECHSLTDNYKGRAIRG